MKAYKPNSIVARFPTSIGQKRCWFMEQMHPGNRGLNLAVRWELRGPVTSDMVAAAFGQIIARHEILRTCFVEQDGEPMQQVVDHVEFKVDDVDVRALAKADRVARINAIAVEHAEQPFDMRVPCLLRVAMIRTDTQCAELLIAVHNAVFDGFSIGVLGHELGLTLDAISRGNAPDLPDLELQYGDYAQWSEDLEKSGGMDAERSYWVETLRGMPYFELPADRPRTAGTAHSATCASDLPSDFEVQMGEAAKARGTSVFALGAAAFSIALARFSGKRDVSFAVQVAGRTDVDLEPLIGIFTNPVVLRFDVDESQSLEGFSGMARDIVNGALAHQNLQFDKLVQAINPPRDPLRIPLVSIMFNLQKAFLKERQYGDLEIISVPSHSPATLYDLNVNIVGRNAGWRMVIDYNADLFDADTLRTFSDLVVDVFAQIVARPERLIEDIPLTARNQLTHAAAPKTAPTVTIARKSGDSVGKIATIWAEILALPQDRISGSFFDLGGHSVLALRMLAKVGDEFDQRPSLYAFLADPTVEGLSALLGNQDEGETSDAAPLRSEIWDLVELRQGDEGSPVLLTVNQPFMYHALAQQMSAGCTVSNIGVPERGALGQLREAGFDEAVNEAARLVQAQYQDRPLVICGLCVDGRVALGLAQALRRGGKQVAVVGMIDTWAPGAIKAFSTASRAFDKWRIRMRRVRYYLGLKWEGEITWGDFLRQNSFAANMLGKSRLGSGKSEIEALVDDTIDCLVDQTRGYDFDVYQGEVVLFVTRAQGLVPRDGVLGWSGKLAQDVAVFPVDGWHGDALTRSGFDRVIGVLDDKMQRLRS